LLQSLICLCPGEFFRSLLKLSRLGHYSKCTNVTERCPRRA
jgi:hypothetical protein